MEIGVSQSIFTKKNTIGYTGQGYYSTTTFDNFRIIFSYFQMWRQFSLSLGFRFFSFVFFIHFPCYYWLYLSNQHLGEEYALTWSPSGIFLLVFLNKSHIGVVSTNIRIYDCHVVLLIYNFNTFWGADKV